MNIYIMRKEDLQIFKLIHLENEDKYIWKNISREITQSLERYKNKLTAISNIYNTGSYLFTDIEIFNNDNQAVDYFLRFALEI